MKKISLLASTLLFATAFGQVGINTDNPQGAFHVHTGTTAATDKDVVVSTSGNIGIGEAAPTAKIDIVTAFTPADPVAGTPASGTPLFRLRNTSDPTGTLGKILTAVDSHGNADWQTPGTSNAYLGTLTTNGTDNNYDSPFIYSTTDNNINSTAYSGMFIDLPQGTYQINFTVWLTLYSKSLASDARRFGAVFFSKSATSSLAGYRPTYTTGIKSVIMNPTYASGEPDYYGSGAIPINVTAQDITDYGAARTPVAGEPDAGYVKEAGKVRYYLWVYVTPSSFQDGTPNGKVANTRTQSLGFFGPYTQLYALPFAVSK